MLRTPIEQRKSRAWILQLSAGQRATLFATFAGWMLDGMDVMVYSFVVPTLISLWHINHGQAGVLATSALVVSAVGGWLAGLAADRFGRVRVLQWTILWFALFTCLSGFTNSFSQLLVIRSLQGLGFGGEWAVGSVLMSEAIGSQHRGKAVGTVQSGWAIGWGLAASCFAISFSFLPAALAWRAMFWIGILPAFLIFYIRGHVHESPIYAHLRESGRQSSGRLFEIFDRRWVRTTALTSLLALGAQGGYYAIMTWLPLYLKNSRRLSVLNTTGYLSIVIAGSLLGYLVSADLTDRVGRRFTLALFAVCSFVVVWAYTLAAIGGPFLLVLGFPLGFFSSGCFSPMGSLFAELFPTQLRCSGQGFAYNSGRGLGALFPALVGYLANRIAIEHAIAVFALLAYSFMIIGTLLLPETKGRSLVT